MEEVPVRAITIGVSVFLFIITLTVALLYINTAKGLANEINENRQNIAVAYDDILNDDITETKITGNDFINFIKDNVKNNNIIINITTINENDITKNKDWINNIQNLADGKLSMIKSTDNVTLEKTIRNNVIEINAKISDTIGV